MEDVRHQEAPGASADAEARPVLGAVVPTDRAWVPAAAEGLSQRPPPGVWVMR